MEVPVELLESCSGFSVDIGTSLVKILYMPKEYKVDKEAKYGRLSLATFPLAEMDKAILFIRENCHVKREEGVVPVVPTTGGGSYKFVTTLEDTLKIKQVNESEWPCLARGFAYLCKNLDPSSFLEQGTIDHRQEAMVLMAMLGAIPMPRMKLHFDVMGKMSQKSADEIYALSPLMQQSSLTKAFPCLLVTCGSSFFITKVYEDGTYEIVDVLARGGLAFMGLGSLLTGSKTFDELCQMCESGDSYRLDTGLLDLQTQLGSGEDVYSSAMRNESTNMVVYSFGKAAGKTRGDFKQEDIAKALLTEMVVDATAVALNIAVATQINDVVFCGSLVNQPLLRETIEKLFMKKKVYTLGCTGQGEQINLHFLKNASHVNALGALVSHSWGSGISTEKTDKHSSLSGIDILL